MTNWTWGMLPYTWCLIFWLHWQLLWSIPHVLHHLLLELNIQHYPLMLFWRQPRIFTHQNTMRKKRKIIGPYGLTLWPFDSQPHFPILESPILPPNVVVKCLSYWARERIEKKSPMPATPPSISTWSASPNDDLFHSPRQWLLYYILNM